MILTILLRRHTVLRCHRTRTGPPFALQHLPSLLAIKRTSWSVQRTVAWHSRAKGKLRIQHIPKFHTAAPLMKRHAVNTLLLEPPSRGPRGHYSKRCAFRNTSCSWHHNHHHSVCPHHRNHSYYKRNEGLTLEGPCIIFAIYGGRTESHEQLFFFAYELGTTDEGECGRRWNQLLCYP